MCMRSGATCACMRAAQGGFTLLGPSSVVHGRDPWYEMQAELSDGRSVPLWCVDAFADGPFTGNQVGDVAVGIHVALCLLSFFV